jgi:hypothetical protein
MFQQTSSHLQGVFSRELKELFTSKYIVWLVSILYREIQELFTYKYLVTILYTWM